MEQPHIRRSQGTRTQRREQLPWCEEDFRILSIDGGGIKGIFPAAILAECERRFIRNQSAGAYFDLIAGTSTGGIIALGLGIGMQAEEVLALYLDNGEKIFPKGWSPPTAVGRYVRKAYDCLRDIAFYRYDRKALEEVVTTAFGDRLYGDCERCLNIPTFDGYNEVTVLKTPHHPDFQKDWRDKVVKVALSTSAAPTFFSVYKNGGEYFADGGVWANNPIMVALVDALTCFDVDRHKVNILSLGCGNPQTRMTKGQIHRGGLWHWKKIMETAMELQSQNVQGQAGLLIGRERLTRLSPPTLLKPIALDDVDRARSELPEQAIRVVEDNSEVLEAMFDFKRPVPIYFHGSRANPDT